MKYLIGLFLMITCIHIAFAEGMEFHHGTWAEALVKSKESGKLIFLDAFTTWCGPCKMMSAKTFPAKEVGDFYNANFINVKMDMEKGDGLMLAGNYSVSAYPSLLFIDGDGKLVMKAVGYMEAEKFISTGKSALKKNDKSAMWAKEYESGKRDFTTVYNYVRSLNQAGKSSLKIANEYLNTQKDLSSPDNLKFLFEAATESDSRIFDLMLKQKDKLIPLYGEDGLHTKILTSADKTVKKAMEYKMVDLLSAAQDKIKSLIPTESSNFNFESNVAYYIGINDGEGLYKVLKKTPADIEKNITKMNALAISLESSFGTDTKLLSQCEQLLSKALPSTDIDPNHLFTLARILALNKKSDKADKIIDQAISLAKSKKMDSTPMEIFKQQLAKS